MIPKIEDGNNFGVSIQVRHTSYCVLHSLVYYCTKGCNLSQLVFYGNCAHMKEDSHTVLIYHRSGNFLPLKIFFSTQSNEN